MHKQIINWKYEWKKIHYSLREFDRPRRFPVSYMHEPQYGFVGAAPIRVIQWHTVEAVKERKLGQLANDPLMENVVMLDCNEVV
jgi:hypothetical protein